MVEETILEEESKHRGARLTGSFKDAKRRKPKLVLTTYILESTEMSGRLKRAKSDSSLGTREYSHHAETQLRINVHGRLLPKS